MISYQEIAEYFGQELKSESFQSFLNRNFDDLTDYNILDHDYVNSEMKGVELGFKNDNAIFDDDDQIIFDPRTPIFSHVILHPNSIRLVDKLPFGVSFKNDRKEILEIVGNPLKTSQGESILLGKSFLVDHYLNGDIAISFDYDVDTEIINYIQIRSNNLMEDHIKL